MILREAAIVVLSLAMANSGVESKGPEEHQRLMIKNTFKDPAKVVEYYCARDASGFVWSGFLDIERRAFTTWDFFPEMDSFLVAKGYQIGSAKFLGKSQD